MPSESRRKNGVSGGQGGLEVREGTDGDSPTGEGSEM